MFRENLLMSWDNIIHNKMRSFLTSLGIVIGIAAVIALITIVMSVTGAMMSQFESLGAGKVSIITSGTPLKQGLAVSDLNEIEKVENVAGVAPTLSLSGNASKQGVLVEGIQMQGKSQLYFESDESVISGRPLTFFDMGAHNYVCVIDETLAENIFKGQNPIGERIMLNGKGFEVVGLTAASSDNMMSMMAGGGRASSEGTAIIPYEVAMSLSGAANIRSIEVYLEDPNLSADTIEDIEATLDAIFNYKDDSYSVINMESVVEMMGTMQSMLTSLLGGIASISLIVGGIGIMNMMLVSVTERTKEIGLRKALGAEPMRIQVQFIMEAITLSLIGGVIGILLGLGLAAIGSRLLDTEFSISWGAIVLGAGFSIAVGLVFGWAPARKASALKPIDALRSE